jgi:hypothetical protein
VVLGLVTMKFRVTIFWNAPTDEEHKAMAVTGYGNYDATNTKVWTMHGRQRAYQRELSEILPGSKLVRTQRKSIPRGHYKFAKFFLLALFHSRLIHPHFLFLFFYTQTNTRCMFHQYRF